MKTVQGLMKLIDEYAHLYRLKAETENDAYTWEWRQAVKEDVDRDLPRVKAKLEKTLKELL